MTDVQIGITIVITMQTLVNFWLLRKCKNNGEAVLILLEVAETTTKTVSGLLDITKAHQKKFDEAIEC